MTSPRWPEVPMLDWFPGPTNRAGRHVIRVVLDGERPIAVQKCASAGNAREDG